MEKKFKYDAFISYRHTDLDKFVAENLHRELESFKLPRSVAKKRPGQKNKIERRRNFAKEKGKSFRKNSSKRL